MANTKVTTSGWTHHDGAALVVGGTGGIGAAIVRMLAERGARVVFTYRGNVAAARALEDSVPGARGVRLDLADPDAVADVVGAAAREPERLHTLVYAAGPPVPQRHLSTIAPERFREQLIDDAAGLFAVIHAALPALRRSRGAIVAVTSAATGRYAARDGLSVIPKSAVESLVRGIAVEEGRFGIRANCVGPGMLSDGMAETLVASGDLDDRALEAARRNTPLRRFGSSRDIAEAVCFLASDAAGFVSGQKLDVDGGYSA